MTTLTDEDRTRLRAFVEGSLLDDAILRTAIHEASHAMAYVELADGLEYDKDDVILTLYCDAGQVRGNCISPRFPGRLNAVKIIAGIVGESLIGQLE